jgi:hypothetical protein
MPQLNRLDELVKKQSDQVKRLQKAGKLTERSRFHSKIGTILVSKKYRKLFETSPGQLFWMKVGILVSLILNIINLCR